MHLTFLETIYVPYQEVLEHLRGLLVVEYLVLGSLVVVIIVGSKPLVIVAYLRHILLLLIVVVVVVHLDRSNRTRRPKLK